MTDKQWMLLLQFMAVMVDHFLQRPESSRTLRAAADRLSLEISEVEERIRKEGIWK